MIITVWTGPYDIIYLWYYYFYIFIIIIIYFFLNLILSKLYPDD